MFFLTGTSQAQDLTGRVYNLEEQPLASATLMAIPQDKKTEITFATTDSIGNYTLKLQTQTNYLITVSAINYQTDTLHFKHQNKLSQQHFYLLPKTHLLKELTIVHQYRPVVIKKDTMTFHISAFTDGSERKLKDQLSKLPGFEIAPNGQITVNGKAVQHFLVEGESFFSNSSKLGVENIPADAVEKVEVIDHFTEVAHMKQVLGSEELAVNIKLKDHKKKLIFGNLTAAGGEKKRYELQGNTFYYAPKLNFGSIINTNNTGMQPLSKEDLGRIQSQQSPFIKHRNVNKLFHFNSFLEERKDVLSIKNQLTTQNLSYKFSDKTTVNTHFTTSKNTLNSQVQDHITYFQNTGNTREERFRNSHQNTQLILFNSSIKYSKNKNTTFEYTLQINNAKLQRNTALSSISEQNSKNFDNTNFNKYQDVKQEFSYLKTYNRRHKSALVVTSEFQKYQPQMDLSSNTAFLEHWIPWQVDSISRNNFYIQQMGNQKQTNTQFINTHFWMPNSSHHLYSSMGLSYHNAQQQAANFGNVNEEGILEDMPNFGNEITYKLIEPFVRFEYQYEREKMDFYVKTQATFLNLQTTYPTTTNHFKTVLWQPALKFKYHFSDAQILLFNYEKVYDIPQTNKLTNQYQISSFNTLYVGDPFLKNTHQDQVNLNYTDFNTIKGYHVFASIAYNYSQNNIRNGVQRAGIDQLMSAFNNPFQEQSWRATTHYGKMYKKWNWRIFANTRLLKFTQRIEEIDLHSATYNHTFGATAKTNFKNTPNFKLDYSKIYSSLQSTARIGSTLDLIHFSVEGKLFEQLLLIFKHQTNINNIYQQQTQRHQMLCELEYNPQKSSWNLGIKGYNLTGTANNNRAIFTDYSFQNTTTAVLPRMLFVTVTYQL